MTIRAVMFDLGGVLVTVDPSSMLHVVARQTGVAPQSIERVFHDPALLEPFELGHVSPQQYFQQVTQRLGAAWTFEEFTAAWNGMLREERGHAAWLQRLRPHYTLLVLTNTNALHDEHIRTRHAIHPHIHHWIASHAVGCRKPQARIYELALEKAGVPAESMLYFDDLEPNIAAARRLGLQAVHVKNGLNLERELRQLGVIGI